MNFVKLGKPVAGILDSTDYYEDAGRTVDVGATWAHRVLVNKDNNGPCVFSMADNGMARGVIDCWFIVSGVPTVFLSNDPRKVGEFIAQHARFNAMFKAPEPAPPPPPSPPPPPPRPSSSSGKETALAFKAPPSISRVSSIQQMSSSFMLKTRNVFAFVSFCAILLAVKYFWAKEKQEEDELLLP